MSKKVKVTEECVITSDDKGQRSLVANAKEALTTMGKNKIDVYILLNGTPKEDAEKFLKDSSVPYKELLTMEEAKDMKFDACVMKEGNIVLLRDDWTWAMNNIVDELYDNREKEKQTESQQQKMDSKFAEYKRWADEANEARKKRGLTEVPGTIR